jgi:hypothetical protein
MPSLISHPYIMLFSAKLNTPNGAECAGELYPHKQCCADLRAVWKKIKADPRTSPPR